MNGQTNNERLSALIDGELADEERAALEQEVALSPELRHELAELRRVSAVVRELPQIPAPASLHGAVMAEIQQPVHLGNDRPAGSGRAGGRPGMSRLLGLSAAVAVAIGAAVWFSQKNDSQIAGNGGGAPEIISVQQGRREAVANRSELRGSPAESTESVTGSRDITGGRGTVNVETRHRVLQISRDDLTSARVGDIVEAVDANGDAVGVIRLTVVDRKLGVEALQVLLTAQQFETVNGSETEPNADQSSLVAVYVESDREKLSQAISEFRRQLDFGSLEVASPVSVAALEPETRNELGIDRLPDSATATPSQRTVALKPGSQLDRLVQSDVATADGDKSATGAADVPKVVRSSDKPVRVIFVVVDGPATGAKIKAAPKENDAA
ncbi:hypothetical protein GC176_19365 [bacterium]|nr:hypothetical protein [bacterium]